MIPEIREELGCYHWVHIYLHFIKQDELYNREDQVDVEPDPDEDYIKYVFLNDEIERHWSMVFQDNNGGLDGTKALLHAQKWDV